MRTLWEVLPRLGIPTGVMGWPATRRRTPRAAEFAFADRFFAVDLDRQAGRPEALTERAWMFRLGVGDLDPRHLGRFEGEAPEAVLGALAGDVWRQSLARFLFSEGEGQALFVRLPGLWRRPAAFFGGYAERRFEGRQGPEFDRAAAVLASYYAELDTFLAALWAQVERPRLLAVVSPSGVDDPSEFERLAGCAAPRRCAAGSTGRRRHAGCCGEGVRPGTLVTGAALVDVAPTLLYALGLPVARDLDGRLLTEAFTAVPGRPPAHLRAVLRDAGPAYPG